MYTDDVDLPVSNTNITFNNMAQWLYIIINSNHMHIMHQLTLKMLKFNYFAK